MRGVESVVSIVTVASPRCSEVEAGRTIGAERGRSRCGDEGLQLSKRCYMSKVFRVGYQYQQVLHQSSREEHGFNCSPCNPPPEPPPDPLLPCP